MFAGDECFAATTTGGAGRDPFLTFESLIQASVSAWVGTKPGTWEWQNAGHFGRINRRTSTTESLKR